MKVAHWPLGICIHMQIGSWYTTKIIYSTKTTLHVWNACLERWTWNTWRVSICRGACETASNAVRIRMSALKQKQISKNLAEAAENHRGRTGNIWSPDLFVFGLEQIGFTGEMRLEMSLCDRFWWQQMMKRMMAVSRRYLMLSIGYMAENIHFWQKATTAETAA